MKLRAVLAMLAAAMACLTPAGRGAEPDRREKVRLLNEQLNRAEAEAQRLQTRLRDTQRKARDGRAASADVVSAEYDHSLASYEVRRLEIRLWAAKGADPREAELALLSTACNRAVLVREEHDRIAERYEAAFKKGVVLPRERAQARARQAGARAAEARARKALTEAARQRLAAVPSDLARWTKQHRDLGSEVAVLLFALRFSPAPSGLAAPGEEEVIRSADRLQASFYLDSPKAGDVIYVLDVSGSMIEYMDYVRNEGMTSLARLSPSQRFHVLLMGGDRLVELPGGGLRPATTANWWAAHRYLYEVNPQGGGAGAAKALARALAVLDKAPAGKGEKVIHFVTDRLSTKDGQAALAMVRKHGKKTPVRIHTYLPFPRPGQGGDLLKQISQTTGGTYKPVKWDW